jgi:uncharacterized membrane protein YkoI
MLALAIFATACEKEDGDEAKGEKFEGAVSAELAKQATFPADSAQRMALAQVPGGRVTKEELEEEDGKLIYSFDIKVGTQEGVEEVHIDAKTGAFLKKEHEGGEKAEAKKGVKDEEDDDDDEKAETAKKPAPVKRPAGL